MVPLHGEVVDRLAIAVGHQVITQLQLDEELRVIALMNHQPIKRTLEERRAAADRLVEQLLIKHEMEVSRYPLPSDEDVSKYLQQVSDQNGGAAGLAKALRSYDLTENTLRQHLELQLTTLRFVEYRFQPDAAVSDADVEAAYRREVAGWRATHGGNPPTLEASRERIRSALLEERTGAALDAWLAESRTQVNIVYLDKALQ
ncbi:MAG TPA: hypothetical protein VGL97_21780 [Bryobacteraceae bacterium]